MYRPYSFSKLDTYDQCNAMFKFQYIDKAPKSETDLTPLLKGGAVHSILENYPEESTHKLAPKYQHIADAFIESHLGKKYLHRDSTREYSFGLTPELEPCEYKDKTAVFRGFIDYICIIDGVINLIDWKTSKKMKEEKWQNFNQLMFYAIYFFKKYPTVNTIKISYVYVEHNDENSITLERKYLENYIQQLMNLIESVEQDTEFKKNITKLCEWCQYQEHCSST